MSLSSVNETLNDASDAIDGYVIGEVVENVDPLGVARVKVKIPGVMDPAEGEVPWVGPLKRSPFGQGPDYGVYGSPQIGSKVAVKFQGGDLAFGQYEGVIYSKGIANPKFQSPRTWGFKDPSGNELFVNLDTGAWEWTHASGFTEKWNGSGDLAITSPGKVDANIEGTVNVNIQGTLNITVAGVANIQASTINLN